MASLFVIKMIFQEGLSPAKDQYSCLWPLTPDSLRNSTKRTSPETFAEDRKRDCLCVTHGEYFSLTAGRCHAVVGMSKEECFSGEQSYIWLDQENPSPE